MHIAFVNYEYPPETPNGGIATYVQQAARMLHSHGHDVEVFAGSLTRDAVVEQDGIRVHRVRVDKRPDFAHLVVPHFVRRHGAAPFDVVEGPDYDADARYAVQQAADVPFVVRLHTPAYLAATLNDTSITQNASLTVSAARLENAGGENSGGLQCPLPLPGYNRFEDAAYTHVLQADAITAPSHAIREVVCRDWHLQADQIAVFPNVYQPAPALLELPLAVHSRLIAYVGRLEQRKGVIALAQAVPLILRQCPDARFLFVGRALASPDPELDMLAYLQRVLAPYADAITLSPHVPLETIPDVLRDAEVCVFPSLWENFPGVCLEAMAAGRGIVGSRAGGMAEMLADGAGLLIAPDSPTQIAQAVTHLLAHPDERMQRGMQARRRVQALYGAAQVAPQHEAGYIRAIRHRRALGIRRQGTGSSVPPL